MHKLRRNISILQFHNVTDEHRQSRLWLAPKVFERYLAYMTSADFEIVSMKAALQIMGRAFPGMKKRPISLTFDHGYADFYEHVFPLLQAAGVPATVLVSPNKIGKEVKTAAGTVEYLEAAQLRELADNGISVGAYEDAAWNISEIVPSTVQRHVRGYKGRLEDVLGRKVRYFGVKEGVPSGFLRDLLISTGYEAFLTQCPTHRRPDPYAVGRVQVDDDDFNIFLTKISKTYLFFKDKRSWKYIREYKLDRVAHRVSETFDQIRGIRHGQ